MNKTIVHQYQLLYKAYATAEAVNYMRTLVVKKISAGHCDPLVCQRVGTSMLPNAQNVLTSTMFCSSLPISPTSLPAKLSASKFVVSSSMMGSFSRISVSDSPSGLRRSAYSLLSKLVATLYFSCLWKIELCPWMYERDVEWARWSSESRVRWENGTKR